MKFVEQGDIGKMIGNRPVTGATGKIINFAFAERAKGFRSFAYPAGYATAGALAGDYYYQNYVDVDSDGDGKREGSTSKRIFAVGLGALGGLGLRSSPALIRLGARGLVTGGEMASLGAAGYAAKKLTFDPAVSGLEYWLNKRKHFDLEEAIRPHLFSSTEVENYVEVDQKTLATLIEGKPDEAHADYEGKRVELSSGRIL